MGLFPPDGYWSGCEKANLQVWDIGGALPAGAGAIKIVSVHPKSFVARDALLHHGREPGEGAGQVVVHLRILGRHGEATGGPVHGLANGGSGQGRRQQQDRTRGPERKGPIDRGFRQ